MTGYHNSIVRGLIYTLLLIPEEWDILDDKGNVTAHDKIIRTVEDILRQKDKAIYVHKGNIVYVKDIRDYIGKYVQ